MDTIVFDICTFRAALEGTVCPDDDCRREGPGHVACGNPRCAGNGNINNGFGPLRNLMELLRVPGGAGDYYNHPLGALSYVASMAREGLVRLGRAQYQETELIRQLHGQFTREDVVDTLKNVSTVSRRSNGPVATSRETREAVRRFNELELSDVDHHALYTQSWFRNGASRIDFEDAMQYMALVVMSEKTGGPVVLVTEDRGFIAARDILARYYPQVYIMSAREYLDSEGATVRRNQDLTVSHAAYAA